jgi:glycosyltransferase involved in cell wall biosynthesis
MTAAITEQPFLDLSMQSGRPRVSVIIIFLDAERFLDEAIKSVFDQTFRDWELLLVNDGSTDRSTQIAFDWTDRHPGRVIYLSHDGDVNRGMSASRNVGIERSQGQYIAFLDADDVWLPHKLEQQVAILDSQPTAAMVYGATEYWKSWTGKKEDQSQDRVPELAVRTNSLIEPPELLSVLLRNPVVTTTGALARREVVERLGGFEESFRGLHEDQVFYTKICLQSPVFVSSECWYRYRRHSDSFCARAEKSGEHNQERLLFLKWVERYLTQNRINDNRVWEALKKANWEAEHPTLFKITNYLRYRARLLREELRQLARRWLPKSLVESLRRRRHGSKYIPPPGHMNLGDLRRTSPVSLVFGFDRGLPVDRYYIEEFLARNASSIHGRVLEIGDDSYTRKYGGDRVTDREILSVDSSNTKATIIADLSNAENIESDSFDCIILTQTLHLIYDVPAALRHLYRILKPRGLLMATFPGISQIDHYQWHDSWYWGFTTHSANRLFAEVFGADKILVENYGNVLSATAFLQGLAYHELTEEELNHTDSDYQLLIAVRAEKR